MAYDIARWTSDIGLSRALTPGSATTECRSPVEVGFPGRRNNVRSSCLRFCPGGSGARERGHMLPKESEPSVSISLLKT